MRLGGQIATVAALLVAGCVATPNVPRGYVLSEPTGKGLVVGTITGSRAAIADYHILYRKIGGGGEGHFHLKSDDPEFNGALIVAELPAGDYEIYEWRIRWGANFYREYQETRSDVPFSIPFRVDAGRPVYIGNCDFQFLPLTVRCTDQLERDRMQFESFYPALRNSVVLTPLAGQPYKSSTYHVFKWNPDSAGVGY